VNSLPWDDVRLFLALCRARTVGEAAKALGIDPSTVSRRLAALEEALATTLFARSRDGITPTKAAEDLLAAAEQVEQGVARFTSAVDSLERDVSGLVRMTCPGDVADVIVVPMLRELLAKHPQLRVALDAGESVLDLTRREADIALRVVRPTRGDLVMTKLTTARWLAAASPELAARLGTLASWGDAPWIGWGEHTSALPPARWLAEHAPDVDPVLRSDRLTIQIAAACEGLGVALLPAPSVTHYGLVELELGAILLSQASSWPSNDLYLVTHAALRDVPRVRVVWDALVASIARLGV
jgi:DNA-binding transcriptional LysR family regulator